MAEVPVVVQKVPEQHDFATVLEEIRDTQVIFVILRDRTPQEDRITLEEFLEDRDALLLDSETVLQVETRPESLRVYEVLVNDLARNQAVLLVIVEPLLHLRLQVICGESREFQLRVLHLLHPEGIPRSDKPINDDVEFRPGFVNDRGLNDAITKHKPFIGLGHEALRFHNSFLLGLICPFSFSSDPRIEL